MHPQSGDETPANHINHSFSGLSLFLKLLIHSQLFVPKMLEQFLRAPYNYLIKELNICNIPLSESEEYDI